MAQEMGVGEAVKCGDEIHRVLFPGIAVHSLDGEEAYVTCAARGASADYPCPRCLIHKSQLHNLTGNFPFHTSREMHKVYKKAIAARTKAEAEEVLKKKGLHKVLNAFWSIANSDPYHASSYDLIHADDLGKWGKHLFVLLKEVLGSMKKNGDYSQNMDKIPHWPGYGNNWKLETMYGKDFNFPKQHAPAHIDYDITHKGATNNYTTRVGEGFQQEVQQAYLQTNFKNVEAQVRLIMTLLLHYLNIIIR
ncbi:hypothetical protein JB92DRAFT_3081668 [Gautieria morchelliformis]|nr:hypothetical protein JB92DRAFT_3081668 [Gautieria morchelliformis]